MTILTSEFEVASPFPPAKIFKAFILDSAVLVPKIFPDVITSITYEGGDGGPGTIKIFHFSEDSQFNLVKERVDALDKENFMLGYTVIEGDPLMNMFEKISCEVKFEAAPDGGSICKRSSKSYVLDGVEFTEEEKKAADENTKQVFIGLFKAFVAYLVANPEAFLI